MSRQAASFAAMASSAVHRQKAKSRRHTRFALQSQRIGDGFSRHLVTAAEPQNVTAPPDMRKQVQVPALGPEKRQIADRSLAAGQDDQPGVPRQRPARRDAEDPRGTFGFEGVKIVVVR